MVSIIMPSYNQGDYLGEALDSVLAQTYSDWECIIIDDGSTDNTKDIAELYCNKDKRVKYLYQENQGVVVARNNAISKCSGELILPLDGDDRIGASYLEKAVKILKSNPNIKVVYCDAEFFGGKTGFWKLPKFSIEMQLCWNCIFCTALFRKKDYENAGGYNINMKEGLEDWDFWLSMFENGGEAYKIPEVLFYYRIKDSSTSRNKSFDKKYKKLVKQIFLNHQDLYFEHLGNIFNSYYEYNKILDSKSYSLAKIISRITTVFK